MAKSTDTISAKELFVHEILEKVADKWTLLAIDALEQKTLRFSELQRSIGTISQKMLTKTLRELERDGLVIRTVYPSVPPKVEYRLTRLGLLLGEAVCGIWEWTEKHMKTVQRARIRYDAVLSKRRSD